MDERATLRSHLNQSASQTPHGAAAGEVIEAIAAAAVELAARIADGPLAGITGAGQGINSDGDQQKDIDVLADELMRAALRNAPVAAVLSEEVALPVSSHKRDFSAELGVLGYPGFSYLRGRRRRNPAEVLLEALNEPDLDARVAEGLPWLAMTYVDMDWDWLVRNAKVHDRQNRLGFAVSLASEVSEGRKQSERARKLRSYLEVLERARLAREDTFCHDSITQAERAWLREHRSPAAAHWNLLTDMKGEHLAYASE